MGLLNNFILLNINSNQQKAIEILKDNQDLFYDHGGSSFFYNLLKSIAWMITINLYKLVDLLNEVLNSIISFGGVLNNEKVVELSNAMTPVALFLMELMIAIITFMFIVGQRVLISQFLINIILAKFLNRKVIRALGDEINGSIRWLLQSCINDENFDNYRTKC